MTMWSILQMYEAIAYGLVGDCWIVREFLWFDKLLVFENCHLCTSSTRYLDNCFKYLLDYWYGYCMFSLHLPKKFKIKGTTVLLWHGWQLPKLCTNISSQSEENQELQKQDSVRESGRTGRNTVELIFKFTQIPTFEWSGIRRRMIYRRWRQCAK